MIEHSVPQPLTPPVRCTGVVVHGEKVGRTIGFPTANLAHQPEFDSVKPGVYFGHCQVVESVDTKASEDTHYNHDCLVYYGPRYIFGEEVNSFEVFLYDYSGDLYGKTLSVLLSHYQRPPEKINNLDQLRQLLERDKLVGETLRNLHKS